MDDKNQEEIIEDTPPASDAEEKPETAETQETPEVPDSPAQVEAEEPEAGKRIRINNLSPRQLLELDTCTRCSECVQWCPVYAQDEKDDLTPRAKAKAFRKILRVQDGIPSNPARKTAATGGVLSTTCGTRCKFQEFCRRNVGVCSYR